jgi:hypothetical protein
MSISGDLRTLAPKSEDVGGSLLRIGTANLNTAEQLGAIVAIVIGGILAPKHFKKLLSQLAASTDTPEVKDVPSKGTRTRKEEVR